MEVFSTQKVLILMNYLNTSKETNIKQSKDTQVVKLSLMTQPSTNQLTFSFQLLWKRLLTRTMHTNSKLNLSLRLLTDQQQWKENKFWEKEESNFYLIFYVTPEVSLLVTSNGWKIWNTSDQEEWTENGNKKPNKTFWMLFKKLLTYHLKDSHKFNFWKEPDKLTLFMQVWKKLCQMQLKKSLILPSKRILTWELLPLSTQLTNSTNTIL